jgi:hypothetical protein
VSWLRVVRWLWSQWWMTVPDRSHRVMCETAKTELNGQYEETLGSIAGKHDTWCLWNEWEYVPCRKWKNSGLLLAVHAVPQFLVAE